MGPAVAVSVVRVGVTMVFVMFAEASQGGGEVRLAPSDSDGKTVDPRMAYTLLSTRTKTSQSRV